MIVVQHGRIERESVSPPMPSTLGPLPWFSSGQQENQEGEGPGVDPKTCVKLFAKLAVVQGRMLM